MYVSFRVPLEVILLDSQNSWSQLMFPNPGHVIENGMMTGLEHFAGLLSEVNILK